MDERVGGGRVSRFSVEIFMSHTAKNFRKGILLFLRKFLFQKVLWMKNFVGIPSMFQKIGVMKNFMHNRGYHIFPSKIFCLTVPKNFVCIPSMSQKIWGIEKIFAK